MIDRGKPNYLIDKSVLGSGQLIRCIAGLALLTLVLAACDGEPPTPVVYIRAIKTFTVSEVASGQTRKYSGIVQATNVSALSFQVSGNVKVVNVKAGDHVKKGQILAEIDKKPYELDVQAATAQLAKAQAGLAQARAEYGRQRDLFKKGWIAKARLDKSVRAFESANSDVAYAVSKLNLAKRDLKNTVLVAPFDGSISSKLVDAFVEVRTGQKLFEIEAIGALEVAFDVPETTISRMVLGLPVSITFTTPKTCRCKGRITEIGSSAGRANAYPIKASLIDPPSNIRSGMTAEISIRLHNERQVAGFFVPLAAIAPAPGKPGGHGYVFVFQSKTSTVKKTPIRALNVSDNMVAVEGIKAGDIIAVAGVNYLADKQKVKLVAKR